MSCDWLRDYECTRDDDVDDVFPADTSAQMICFVTVSWSGCCCWSEVGQCVWGMKLCVRIPPVFMVWSSAVFRIISSPVVRLHHISIKIKSMPDHVCVIVGHLSQRVRRCRSPRISLSHVS